MKKTLLIILLPLFLFSQEYNLICIEETSGFQIVYKVNEYKKEIIRLHSLSKNNDFMDGDGVPLSILNWDTNNIVGYYKNTEYLSSFSWIDLKNNRQIVSTFYKNDSIVIDGILDDIFNVLSYKCSKDYD